MVLSSACCITINVAHLTQKQQIQLLTSLAMMRFKPSIKPITFPTPSRYATCYAMEAGTFYTYLTIALGKSQAITPLILTINSYFQNLQEAGEGGGCNSMCHFQPLQGFFYLELASKKCNNMAMWLNQQCQQSPNKTVKSVYLIPYIDIYETL